MIERAELERRCVTATADANDSGRPIGAPELAALWDRPHDGLLPEWFIDVIDEDGKSTYVQARISRTLASFFADPAPFNVRGPYIPRRLSRRHGDRWPYPEKWSLHDPELRACRCYR